MTDLEMIKKCAEKMGVDVQLISKPKFKYLDCPYYVIPEFSEAQNEKYDPLHDDAQAMALVKDLKLQILPNRYHGGWWVSATTPHNAIGNADLNRAICECVARMQ